MSLLESPRKHHERKHHERKHHERKHHERKHHEKREKKCYCPIRTVLPAQLEVCYGNLATWTLKEDCRSLIQWQYSVDGINFIDLFGQNGPVLSIVANSALNNYQYRAIVKNKCGCYFTNASILIVDYIYIISQPVSVPSPLVAGASATITAQIGGNPLASISYQWQGSTDGVTWTNLANAAPYSGVNTNVLSISVVPAAPFQYRLVASLPQCAAGVNGSVITNAVPVVVVP